MYAHLGAHQIVVSSRMAIVPLKTNDSSSTGMPPLAVVGDAGGLKDDEDKKPMRRGTNLTPKSGAERARDGVHFEYGGGAGSDDVGVGGGETHAMAWTIGGASHAAGATNKVHVMDVAMIQTFPPEGQSFRRYRYEMGPGDQSTRKRKS